MDRERARARVALAGAVVAFLSPRVAEAKEVSASDFDTSGLQVSLTRVRGSDRSAELGAFGLAITRVGFGFEKGVAVRVLNTASFAAGAKGLQGGIDNAIAGGYRFSFGKNHGIVARGGIEGSFFGNKYLWDSMLELPQFHLGYQWLERFDDAVDRSGSAVRPATARVFDLAMKAGYILVGRHNTGDAAWRTLSGAPEIGGIASLHLGPFALQATYTRVLARHGGDAIQQLEGTLCGRAASLTVCANQRYEVGEVRTLPVSAFRFSQVATLGLTIAITKKTGPLE